MTTNPNVQNILLKYSIDDPALAKLREASQGVIEDFKNIAGSGKDAFKSFEDIKEIGDAFSHIESIDSIGKKFAVLAQVTGDVAGNLEVLKRELGELGASSLEIERATAAFEKYNKEAAKDALSYREVPSEGLRRAGGSISQLGLPEVGRIVTLAGVFQQLSKEVDILAEAFTNMPTLFGTVASAGYAAAGGVGAIIAVLAPFALLAGVGVGALKILSDTLGQANKGLAQAEAQIKQFYESVATGTTDTLAKQEEDLKQKKQIIDNTIAANDAAVAGAFKSDQEHFGDLSSRFAFLVAESGLAGDAVKKFNDENKKLKEQSLELAGQIGGVSSAMNSFEVITRSVKGSLDQAAKGVEDFLNKVDKAIHANIDKGVEADISRAEKNAQLISGGTSAQVQGEIDAIEVKKAAISKGLQVPGITSAEDTSLHNQLTQLIKDENDLTNVVLPAVKAREKETDAAKAFLKISEDMAKSETKLAELRETGTIKQVQTEIDRNNATIEADKEKIRVNKLYLDTLTKGTPAYELLSKAINDTQLEINDLTHTTAELNNVVMPLAQARDREKKALDDLAKSIDFTATQLEKIDGINKKYADEAEKAEEEKNIKIRDIGRKYADKLIDIATEALQKAQDLYTKLVEEGSKAVTDLSRSNAKDSLDEQHKEEDAIRKARRDEVDAQEAHLQRLKDIKNKYDISDELALLNRDYVSLAKNALLKTQDMGTENDTFIKQEQARVKNLNYLIEDDRINLQRQREERLLAYSQALEDAATQYKNEMKQNAVQEQRKRDQDAILKQREIDAENQHAQDLTNVRISNQKRDVANVSISEQQIYGIRAGYEAKAIAMIGAAYAIQSGLLGSLLGSISGNILGRADGGELLSGQISRVNEPGISSGRESFSNSNGTMVFPGFGIFRPMAGGQVNANKERPAVNNNWYITNTEANPEKVARALEPMVERITERVVGGILG